MVDIFPKSGERALALGRTGTGKTTWILRMLTHFLGEIQIQFLATKDDSTIDSLPYPVVTTIDDVHLLKFPEHPFVIYKPRGIELADKDVLDSWCKWLFDRKNTVGVIDELSQVAHPTHPKSGFLDLITRGRSQNDTFIAGSQRPRGIPSIAYTEAENIYKFHLNDIKDRRRVREFTHPTMENQVADIHGFHYYNPLRSSKVYYIGKW